MANTRKVNFVEVDRWLAIGGGFGIQVRPVGIDQSAEVEVELVEPDGQTRILRLGLVQVERRAFVRGRIRLVSYSSANDAHPTPELELSTLERPGEEVLPVQLPALPPSVAGDEVSVTGAERLEPPNSDSAGISTANVESLDIIVEKTGGGDFGDLAADDVIAAGYVHISGTDWARCDALDYTFTPNATDKANETAFAFSVPNITPALSSRIAYRLLNSAGAAGPVDNTRITYRPQRRNVS